MEQIDEIMKEFLVECYENLDQLDSDLLELEEVPDDTDRLASIFRTIHTIKGTSGFLALPRLEKLTHVGESLLVPLRDGDLRLNADITDALLKMVDAVRTLLGTIENTGGEGEEDYTELTAHLEQLQNPNPVEQTINETFDKVENLTAEKDESSYDVDNVDQAASDPEIRDEKVSDTPETSSEQSNRIVVEGNSAQDEPATTVPAPRASNTKSSSKNESPNSSTGSVADTTLRIDVKILDNLMNLVGELVLSRNQVLQFSDASGDTAMNNAMQKLNLVTSELQEAVMKTRMQPIRNAWNKLPRVVRDLSNACGKKVQVEMEGADTDLDKTVLEAIKDPLTHIVRNSVDHGIETPEQRVAHGKPEVGTLWLRAFHEGGQVNIEIADDGRGMDLDRIKSKAVEKGVVTQDQAKVMSDREVIGLVLLPGFSTAAAVTNVSGRGVGMDVVKTNIERIGGTLEIHSVPGQGTTLRIKLPLTLAIVPALVIKSAGHSFAIPQVNLLELVRMEAERASNEIEFVYGAPVYRLRGNLLPLLYLDKLLNLQGADPKSESLNAETDEAINIVVLQAEDRQFGLVVDAITDTQEIVVKPLDHHLKSLATFAGATIMGNGSVSLILDAIGLAKQGGILSDRDTRIRDDRKKETAEAIEYDSWLVVDSGDGSQAAVRLDSVARLEEFSADKIERVDGRSVVQYRGQIMALVDLNGRSVNLEDDNDTNVVVYDNQGQNIGLVVKRILDIVKEPSVSGNESSTMEKVIGGRVTSVVTPKRFANLQNTPSH